MSSFLKYEPKKTKNSTNYSSTNIYNNSNNNNNPIMINNSAKINKLSFSNALKQNTQKKFQTQKKEKKNNSTNININESINNDNNTDVNNISMKSTKINIESKEDRHKEYENQKEKEEDTKNKNQEQKENEEELEKNKKVLINVESYQNLEFLLPKKPNTLIEKTSEKKYSNRRYSNERSYDFDGVYNESYEKKKGIDDEIIKNLDLESQIENKNKTYSSKEGENEEEEESKEKDIKKFEKQEELIKKLLKYKNFQNYIKKCLKHKKLGRNKKGKIIKWSFVKSIYNISFLDLYYKHRLPLIIMRPRLEVIRRKREKKMKSMQKMGEEELKKNGKSNLKNSVEIKEGETTYASILDKTIQNEMEKNGYIIGEDSNTVRIEKRESLFPSKDGKPKGIFTLTKIPQKTDENSGNIRLKLAFNKAKDAARVVRRLEYSYSMRVNILLSKPIFQKNAKIIQNWYRSIKFIKINTPKIVKIQAFVRGMMIKKAFKEVRNLFEHELPFIKEIDKIFARRFAKLFIDKMIKRFGIKILIKLAQNKNNIIINALRRFLKKQKFLRENFSISTRLNQKCCYTKDIYEWLTRIKILKLQTHIKNFLMHNNEKTLLKYAHEYHPKLYYYLKHGKDKELLKKKLKKFREFLNKLKELKIIVKFKKANKNNTNKMINNKYDYLNYLIRKITFNKLKRYYNDSINNKDPNYQKKIKLKILLNHQKANNRYRILKRYFNKWNIIANHLSEYRKILKADKLALIDIIMKYNKKLKEKIFLLLLNSIKEKKENTEKKETNKIFNFYQKHNKIHDPEYVNKILLKALKIWRRKSKLISLYNASNIINRNVLMFLYKKKIKRKYKLINCINIRNKIFKEKLKLWKFNAGKLKKHYNSFINKTSKIIRMRRIIKSLKKILESLEKRKKNI